MTDHKFTDDEIVKALECCSKDVPIQNSCEGCPFAGKKCAAFLPQTALDLIKRQKAEIEELEEIVFMDRSEAIKILKSEAIKEFWSELKRRSTLDPRMISTISGDNLVKEMTEGNK